MQPEAVAMRFKDLATYLRLCRIARNPWATLRFGQRQPAGQMHVVKLLGGPYLYLRPQRNDFASFERIYLQDMYRIRRLPRAGLGVVVDLGGYVGLFAARASRLAARVITYEPYPGHFSCLSRNVAACLNVDAVCAAVAGDAGHLRLYRPRCEARSSIYSSFPERSDDLSDLYDEVPAVTLEDVFVRHEVTSCDLLKLDVEGQEYDILYSAPKDVLECVQRIHGAYHDVIPQNPRTRIERFARFLESRSFEIDIVPDHRSANHGLFFAQRRRG